MLKKNLLLFLFVLIGLELGIWLLESAYYFYHSRLIYSKVKIEENVFRIVCLGESTVEGENIDDPNGNFPYQLEKIFLKNLPKANIKVYNLGVATIGASQIFKNRKFIRKYFKPDILILLAGHNRDFPINFITKVSSKYPVYENVQHRISNLKLVRLIYFAPMLFEMFGDQRKHEEMKMAAHYYLPFFLYSDRSNYTAEDKKSQIYFIKNIIKYFQKNGSKILLCNYFQSKANSFLEQIALEMEVDFCDNEKIYKEYENKKELISADRWHPSKRGYAIMAENIYKSIREMGVVPETFSREK